MRCKDVNECFKQISAYFSGEKFGKFFIVNTENYDIYHDILERLQADSSKKCIYLSQNLYPNELPDIDSTILQTVRNDAYAIIGLSQALMLQSDYNIESKLDELLDQSISGFCIILLDHCEQVLKKFISRDNRIERRVLLVDGETSILPKIRLAKNKSDCIDTEAFLNFGEFLKYMEQVTESQIIQRPEITIISQFSPDNFSRAVYSIRPAIDIYEVLQKKDSNLANLTQKNYGTEEQWRWLGSKIPSSSNFCDLICENFGTVTNLSMNISKIINSNDDNNKWLLWLALKVFGENNNEYLTLVLDNCGDYQDFENHLYMDISDIEINNQNFEKMYEERKNLLKQLPQNLSLIDKYCNHLGKFEKNAIFYLTDISEKEQYEFMKCLSIYDYSDEELQRAINTISRNLSLYMQDFIFDSVNTKLPESEVNFAKELTSYFKEYKLQKLTNRVNTYFLNMVNQYALTRPYNKLQPRSSIISHMDKNKVQLFFFDALGVEYLSFITAKCEDYELSTEIYIGHCELPSITSNNKEFFQYFSDEDRFKIDELDDIKHHSQIYDYQKCKYPLHLFRELEIIDEELQKIQSRLIQETTEKVIIVSDHGASRLAVLYGHEINSTIALNEAGEHSGRCCPTKNDPQLPFVAYENGFSILANYERFKGGRRANVEVHGGASLEEMLVPIIVITKRQTDIEINFTNPTIILKPRTVPEITIYSNIPIQEPSLCIDGEFYFGELISDNKHAKFKLPKIKRKGKYMATVYYGNKKISKPLEFEVKKLTYEVELL